MERPELHVAVIAALVAGDTDEAERLVEASSVADRTSLRRSAEQLLAMTDEATTTQKASRRGKPARTEAATATAHRTADGVELRVVVPPDALASTVRAEFVTQNNCHDVLGMSDRQFLDLLRRADAPPVVKVGKLRLVRRDDVVAYVARFHARAPDAVQPEPDGAEAVLREIAYAPVRR